MRAGKMVVARASIALDRKLVSIPLPERLILYAIDASHLVLAPEPINELERKALSKEKVKATLVDGKYLIEMPRKIYEFYHLDEADYTLMASEIHSRTIEILLG